MSDLRRSLRSTTKDMLVSLAPCAQAMTLIPLRPSVPKSLPAMPGVCFMFSPTMAMVASSRSSVILYMAPISISLANSSLSTSHARSASSSRTPMEVLFSELAWLTMKTLTPLAARVVKMRLLTPMTPTMESPLTVMSDVLLIDDMPLMALPLSSMPLSLVMMVPLSSGRKVFLMRMGMFLMQTG